MDTDVFANDSKKYGYRNLSLYNEPSVNKIGKTTRKSILATTNRYSCLATDNIPEVTNPPQNPSNEASDDISESVKPSPSPPSITVQGVGT